MTETTSNPSNSTGVRRRRRLVLPASVAALAVAGVGVLATSALFTDTQTVGSNTFAAGTVDLTTNPTASAFTVGNMTPGDVVTKPIAVRNSGSLDFRYAVESVATGALAPALTLQVKSGVTDCTNSGFAATGTSLYGAAAPLGTSGGMKVFGDKKQGPDTGDRVLAAGTSEVLCVQVTLPGASTSNDYQTQAADATFHFYAEQTKNNGTGTGGDTSAGGAPAGSGGGAATPDPGGSGQGTTAPASGTVTTIAAGIQSGQAVVYRPGDNLYVASSDGAVFKVDPATGAYSTVATGLGYAQGLTQGPDGSLYVASYNGVLKVDPTTGTHTTLTTKIAGPRGITYGQDGNLYVTAFNGSLYKVDPATAKYTTVATNLNGGGGTYAVTYGADGYLYATNDSGTLYRVDPVAGTTTEVAADLGYTQGVAYGPDGYLYVVTPGSPSVVYKVSPTTGVHTTVVTETSASGVAYGPDGYLYAINAVLGDLYRIAP